MKGNDALLRAIARQAVRRFAGMEPGRPVGGTYYLYRTLRNLDLDAVLDKLMEQTRQQADDKGNPLTPLEERLEEDEFQIRIDGLKKEIEAEIRRRLVADRGVEAMARTLRKPLPEDVDFMHASREEMVGLRKALVPAHPPAGRAPGPQAPPRAQGRARLPQHGPRTRSATAACRPSRSSATRGPHKPEIFVVADISGSVAAFARFTLMLVYAISHQFSKVRAFVFIDGIDEVTSYFEGVEDIDRGGAPGQHRGRRGVGRRPLRLRPRLRGRSGSGGARRSAPRPP